MMDYLLNRRNEKSEAGFTLMELVIVLVILGMLAAVTAPNVMKRFMTSKAQVAKIYISNLEGAVNLFAFDMGRFPTNAEGLEVLVRNVSSAEAWRGPYIEKGLQLDPWERAYIYRNPGEHGGDYDICSLGPDGIAGNDDDVCN